MQGQNITFITGDNGSGKSAILTALQMCLGGRAADAHRGSNAASLIRHQHQGSAAITVTLHNTGSDAYKPEEYGDEIKIHRIISRT
jgi:chromosome segregation ATPase